MQAAVAESRTLGKYIVWTVHTNTWHGRGSRTGDSYAVTPVVMHDNNIAWRLDVNGVRQDIRSSAAKAMLQADRIEGGEAGMEEAGEKAEMKLGIAGNKQRAEDYEVVSADGKKTLAGPFRSYHAAKTEADKSGGLVKFLAEDPVMGPRPREYYELRFANKKAIKKFEKAMALRGFGGHYVGLVWYSEDGETIEAAMNVEAEDMGRGEVVGRNTTVACDFDSIEAAVDHEKKLHGGKQGSIGDGVYVFYPDGMARRIYYASGKYHVARRAEPAELPSKRGKAAAKAKEDFAVATRDVKAVRAGRQHGALRNARAIYTYVHPTLVKYSQEVVLVIPLDHRGKPLCAKPYVVAMGQKAEVSVNVEDVLRPVIKDNASGFVVIHNHPSGEAIGSDADKDLTKRINVGAKKACPSTPMLDHVVVGDGQFYSFADEQLYKVK